MMMIHPEIYTNEMKIHRTTADVYLFCRLHEGIPLSLAWLWNCVSSADESKERMFIFPTADFYFHLHFIFKIQRKIHMKFSV
jgi:hypothetical protein